MLTLIKKMMLSRIISALLLVTIPPNSRAMKVEIDNLEKVPMYSQAEVKIRLHLEEGVPEDDLITSSKQEVVLTANMSSEIVWAIRLLNESVTFTYQDIRRSQSKSLWLVGDIIGVNNLQLWRDNDLLKSEKVSVILAERTLNDIFTLVMILMIIVNTINMGAQLDLKVIKEVLKKPIGPVVGFLSQFLFMPLLSFLVGWLLTDDMLFRLGLFVLGCCPGGTGSNFWTLLLEGDINLSITMTFFSTVAALGMMPLWIFLVAPSITQGALSIPFGQLIISLVALILPTALGMWIRWKSSKAAAVMEKIIIPFTLLTLLFIFTAGIYINLFIFQLITPLMILAGFLVTTAGFVIGALLAWICKLELPQITAVAVETSLQNGSIAFILLKLSLEEPLGELAAVAPVAQLIITGLPLWLLLGVVKIYQRCCKKDEKPNIEERKSLKSSKKTFSNDSCQ